MKTFQWIKQQIGELARYNRAERELGDRIVLRIIIAGVIIGLAVVASLL